MRRRNRWLWLLGIVLVLGGGLRIWGCFGQGYPYSFYPDEEGNVKRALRLGAERTLDPGWFNKPALGYYLLLGEYVAYYGAGRVLGTFDDSEDFALYYVTNPGPFYLIGRISTSLLGALTLLFTWRLGRVLGGRALGAAGVVALVAVTGHVASGQHVKMDVPAAFFTTASTVMLALVMMRGRRRDYIGAGLLAGLAMATKYYALGLLPLYLLAHWFRRKQAGTAWSRLLGGQLWLGVAAFFGGFFLGSPYNFLSSQWWRTSLWPGIRFVLRRLGIVGADPSRDELGGPFVSPEQDTIWDTIAGNVVELASAGSLGLPLTLLAGSGLAAALFRPSRRHAFLLVMVLGYGLFVAICNEQFSSPRHLSGLYPLAAVAAGQGFLWLFRRAGDLGQARPMVSAAVLAAIVCLPVPGFPMWETVRSNLERIAADPRLEALEWIHRKVAEGSVIINDHGTLPLHPSARRCAWALERIERLRQRGVISGSSLFASLEAKWERQRRAVSRRSEPVYDVIDLLHTWQTSSLHLRLASVQSYNPLWPRSPFGALLAATIQDAARRAPPGSPPGVDEAWSLFRVHLAPGERGLAPVELWSQASAASREWLSTSPKEGESRASNPAQWFVTTKERIHSYDLPRRQRNFPDFARWYEDLGNHYARFEFATSSSDPAKQVILFDLRRRYPANPPVRRLDR